MTHRTGPSGASSGALRADSHGRPSGPSGGLVSGLSRWLAVRFGHLGDVLLTTGVLRYWGETRGLRFHVLTRKEWAPVYEGHPFVDKVVGVTSAEINGRPLVDLCRRLSGEYADFGLLDLHGNLRSRLLSAVWRGPVARYTKMSAQRRLFLTSKGAWFGEELRSLSTAQRYALALGDDAPPAGMLRPCLFLAEAERKRAEETIAGVWKEGVRPVALHPFATHSLKTWPVGHWREFVERLEAAGIPWLVVGKGHVLFPGSPYEFTNATTLRETAALLSCCRVLVSGDSGPMHLAGAVGTPVLALFGPTTREWGFYPTGEDDVVLETDLPCRPCSLHGGAPCPRGGECLAAITPERAMQALAERGWSRVEGL